MRYAFAILMSCVTLLVKSQYQNANWPLGAITPMTVKMTPDTFEPYFLQNGTVGNSANTSVSDSQGNLLLFSFGFDIRNRYGNLLNGGCCLCQDSPSVDNICVVGGTANPYQQGALLLPRPACNYQYYLFIKDMVSTLTGNPNWITTSLIDINSNNDSGVVIYSNMIILNGSLSYSRMTACQHGNGRDWWLINHEYLTNKIYTHLITPDSIYGPYEQSIGLPGSDTGAYGWGVFSPTGSIYANTTELMHGITLLDFDRCSGIFSNPRAIIVDNDSFKYFSLAFSPNGRFLYADNNNIVVQYDLQSNDTPLIGNILVIDTAPYPGLWDMSLMADKRIYISSYDGILGDSVLSVIDSPDLKYPDCAFHLRSVLVPHSGYIHNAPNFPNYNLGPVIGSACDTITGIQEPGTRNQELKIMPNPADGCVVISYSAAAAADEPPILTICNPLGQTVYTQTLPMYSGLQKIEVSNWAGGIYMVFIKRSGAVIATGKFVKQ